MTTSQSTGLVYTIILNWNGLADTVECVRSCQLLTYADNVLVVVDNGSSDGSVEELRSLFPDLRMIETGENLGFAGGNNVGIAAAVDEGAEFVWLLNNDTTVDPAALTELVSVMRSRPRAGIAGSKIYYSAEPNTLWFAGGLLDPKRGYSRHRGVDEVDAGRYDTVEPTEYVTGCSLLIRTSVVEQIGLMSEDFFLYWEEVDWNARAAEAGHEILYVPTSVIWHKVSASTSTTEGRLNYNKWRYEVRNRILFHKRHFPERLPRVLLWACLQTAALLTIHRSLRTGVAVARGVLDGVFGRTGKIGG